MESAAPLARGGAAATAFAIAFAIYDYRTHLEQGERKANETFAALTKGFPLTGEESRRRVGAKARSNTEFADRVITYWQAGVLILATLVWGFGDLANSFMRASGSQ